LKLNLLHTLLQMMTIRLPLPMLV